jgi:hypothetical protein
MKSARPSASCTNILARIIDASNMRVPALDPDNE